VREEPRPAAPVTSPWSQAATPAPSPLEPALLRYLGVLAVFTLGNSSDAFLLLRAQETGVALAAIPAVWALHSLVKAAASTWGGSLSDRVGRRHVILAGWGVYALAYAGFAVAGSVLAIVGLFAFYGLFHALTEGAERALVADLAGESTRGRAFGLFHAVTGAALLPASLMTGLLWQRFGAPVALGTGAALDALAALGLLALVPPPAPGGERRS
jgi:MFS family permease